MPLYEFEEGTSRKFYRIDLDGRKVLLHWGRIGTEGEHQILSFETDVQAKAEYDRQCGKRTYERGYRLVVDEGVPHDPEQVSRDRLVKAAPLTDSPRFLFVHVAKKKFAWVEARGSDLVSVKGKREDEDKLAPTIAPQGSPMAAIRARDALVAKWLSQGYELETFGADKEAKATRPKKRVLVDCRELERVVAEDPFDDGRWQVLEDFLLQHPEDPRCEMIEAQKQRALAEEAQARGAALPMLLGRRHAAISKAMTRPVWRAGYLVRTEVGSPRYYRRDSDARLEELLQVLLGSPSARLIRELDLIAASPKALPRLCRAVATAPSVQALRGLELIAGPGAFETLDCSILEGLSLHTLQTARAELHVHTLSALPLLRRLGTAVRNIAGLRRLLAAPAPALQMLALRYMGDQDDASDDQPDAARVAEIVGALQALPAFAPALVTLELTFRTERAAAAARETIQSFRLGLQSLTVSPSGAS